MKCSSFRTPSCWRKRPLELGSWTICTTRCFAGMLYLTDTREENSRTGRGYASRPCSGVSSSAQQNVRKGLFPDLRRTAGCAKTRPFLSPAIRTVFDPVCPEQPVRTCSERSLSPVESDLSKTVFHVERSGPFQHAGREIKGQAFGCHLRTRVCTGVCTAVCTGCRPTGRRG
jgi:hypothetical protein